jgi:hypothetical protein
LTASTGAPGVGHLLLRAEQHEHAVHVGGGLLDLAIDHAQEVERDVELDHQRVDQHEVAQRQLAGGHAHRGAPQDQDQARAMIACWPKFRNDSEFCERIAAVR